MSTLVSYTLPDELWLEVIKKFTYAQLKKFSRICTHFRNLTESPIFDKRLFRTPIEKANPLVLGDKADCHPVFDHLELACHDLDHCFLFLIDEDKCTKNNLVAPTAKEVTKWPFYKEFATNPTTKSVHLYFGPGEVVKNPEGVTVGDIIKKSLSIWNKKLPVYLQSEYETTWMDTLYDHCYFEGFHEVKVVNHYSGELAVSLDPVRFGS